MSATPALRDSHRPRGPRPARDARPRCSAAARTTFGARAQHPDLPGLPGHARLAAGDQPPRRRVRHRDRAGARLRGERGLNRFARKHYYYPDMPKNYQISQYEEPLAEHGRLDDRRGRRRRATIGIQRAAPRGGRGQAHPRGRARDRAVEPGGLQPRRRAADGDRLQARPPQPRGGRRLPEGAPGHPRLPAACATATWRRARSAATPTSRSGRAARPSRHQGRDQEHELVPERPATRSSTRSGGRRARSRPGSASCRRRGSGIPIGPSRVSMRSKEFAHDYRYFPEPDLPPLDLRAGWVDEVRARLPELPAARRVALPERLRALRLRGRPADPGPRRSRTTSRRPSAARGKPKAVANWVLNELLRELPADDDRAVAGLPDPARQPGRAAGPDRRRHHQRQDRQGRVREDVPLGRRRRRRS